MIKLILSCLILFLGVTAQGAEQVEYKTPVELRRAAQAALQPFKPSRPRTPRDFDEGRLFLVDYLGVADPTLRDTAVDILAECRRPIRGSAFRKFLDPAYPMNVRVIALAYVTANAWGGGNDTDALSHDQLVEKLRKPLATMLKDLAEYPVAPAHLEALGRAMASNESFSFLDLSAEEEQRVLFRRIAAKGAGLPNGVDKDGIQICLSLFRANVFVSELSALYSFSPVDFRGYIADVAVRAAITSRYEKNKLQPLLALIAKDWDSAIASKVKAILER